MQKNPAYWPFCEFHGSEILPRHLKLESVPTPHRLVCESQVPQFVPRRFCLPPPLSRWPQTHQSISPTLCPFTRMHQKYLHKPFSLAAGEGGTAFVESRSLPLLNQHSEPMLAHSGRPSSGAPRPAPSPPPPAGRGRSCVGRPAERCSPIGQGRSRHC